LSILGDRLGMAGWTCVADDVIPIIYMRCHYSPRSNATDLTIHPLFASPHPSHLAPGVGSGEFLLIDEKNPEKVHLVVRTINSSAFSNEDWEEYVYEVSSTEHIRLGPVQDHYLQNGDLTICRFSFVDMLMRWIGTVPL
jgi:hypothetical protein